MFTDYDVIIIGSGCAGLAAGIYTSRAGFSTLIMEKETVGGELMNRQLIENYPGFAAGIQGPDLGSAMLEQASSFGVDIESADVIGIVARNGFKTVKTSSVTRTCKAIAIATGSKPRKLQVPGEEELSNKGVFYCATCDGPQLAGKAVVVAGAGDSGITEALHLVKLGCKVTVVEVLPVPKASKVLLDRAEANPDIEIRCSVKITAITGEEWVTAVEIEGVASGANSSLNTAGVLVRIGLIPNTSFLSELIALGPSGQIPVNENMETAIPGIVAAGDIRQYSPVQIATAVGDGVTAAMSLGRYLASLA